MAKRRVRFVSPTMYAGVSYAQNQVVSLDDRDIRTLGDSVEAADDVDVAAEAEDLQDGVLDPDTRRELDIKHEPGDVQDVPDALRDEQANREAEEEAKAVDAAPKNKMVDKPKTKK